jgi:CrcB protein
VAAGAAIGAGARWGIDELVSSDWAMLAIVNCVGAAVLATVVARPRSDAVLWSVSVGLCGGLTTMSSLALAVAERFDAGEAGEAVWFAASLAALGLAAYVAATWASGRVRAQRS